LAGIAEDPVSDVVGALFARANLSIALDDHLSREDAFLYGKLIGTQPDRFPGAVSKFHADFAELASAWQDYLKMWDPSAIASDWTEFCRETTIMMGWLRQRIADENALLYPLALQTGRIRLRQAA
jgi:hypothetical protein